MTDEGRLLVESTDDLLEVVRDLADGLVREDLGMRVCLGHSLGIVRPAGSECGIAGLLEDHRPAIPTAGQQPEAMNEDYGLSPGRIGIFDLLHLMLGDCLRLRLRRMGCGGSHKNCLSFCVW